MAHMAKKTKVGNTYNILYSAKLLDCAAVKQYSVLLLFLIFIFFGGCVDVQETELG